MRKKWVTWHTVTCSVFHSDSAQLFKYDKDLIPELMHTQPPKIIFILAQLRKEACERGAGDKYLLSLTWPYPLKRKVKLANRSR